MKKNINKSYSVLLLKKMFSKNRVLCPNFGHPAPTSTFTKYEFLQMKNSFATIVNRLSVLKLFEILKVN